MPNITSTTRQRTLRKKATMHRSNWIARLKKCFKKHGDMGMVDGTKSPLLDRYNERFSHEDDSSFAVYSPRRDATTDVSDCLREQIQTPTSNVKDNSSRETPEPIVEDRPKRLLGPYSANVKGTSKRDSWPPVADKVVPPTQNPSSRPELTVKAKTVAPAREPPMLVPNRTVDSFGGSLESIDSLAESYWDPEDDSMLSQPGTSSDVDRSRQFFSEHVNFLKVQTQPRQVEVVWTKT